MNGLEAVEVKLSEVKQNKDSRCDSGFWTAFIYKNPNLKYAKIGDVLKTSQYGISISMNENGEGYPIYRMNEIHNMLCDNEVGKFAEITPTELEIFRLQDGDVLFNRTNSLEWVGRTGIFYQNDDNPRVFASYLVKFVPNEQITPEYLTAFLNCKYGVKAVKSRARQSVNQTNVNPEEVKEIQIPLLSMNLQEMIKKCFVEANSNIKRSLSLYAAAENLLLSSLGLANYTPSPEKIAVKSFKDSFAATGRLDSEYYQPKYEGIEQAIKSGETVQTICKLHDSNFIPDEKRDYRYIELSNIGKNGEINGVDIIAGVDLPSRARRVVEKGQVIVSSIEGSLGSCALITEEYHAVLCSTGFYVLSSDIMNSETLLLLFKSMPLQAMMKKRCSGTILTATNKDEFLSLPMPKIPPTIQSQIAEKIQQSFELRKKSTELLEQAKKAVETAIEAV